MKKLMILLLLIIGVREVRGQADPYHNALGSSKNAYIRTIESFGAKPGDTIDDSYAFYKAARFFSSKDTNTYSDISSATADNINYVNYFDYYGVLLLDTGTYIVGEQVFDSSSTAISFARPKYVPSFWHLDGLIIQGATNGKTVVKVKPKSYFGWFNNITHLPDVASDGGIAAFTPTVFDFGWDDKNVVLRDIEIDGSSDTYIVGKPEGNADFNTLSYGVGISSGRYISLLNLYIHNFGMDGIYLEAYSAPASYGKWNVTMDGIRSYWNGRQALSWVWGRDVKIENSEFAYTRLPEGHYDTDAVFTPSSVAGSPGCNIDIEPLADNYEIRNGVFNNCKIMGNSGPSSSIDVQLNTDSIYFNNCVIRGFSNSNSALGSGYGAVSMSTLYHRNVIFDSCDITGTITMERTDTITNVFPDTGMTQFYNCIIAGNNVAGDANHLMKYYPLITMYDRALFDNCTIMQVTERPIFFGYNVTRDENTIPNPNNYTILNNCRILSTYDRNSQYTNFMVPGRMYGLRFTGTTKWSHTQLTTSTPSPNFLQEVTVNGSNLFDPMNSFTFSNFDAFIGQDYNTAGYGLTNGVLDSNWLKRPIIIGETPCEYLKVFIGEDSSRNSTLFNDGRPLYIGEGVILTVRKGSALVLSGDVYLAGKIIIEAEAYFWPIGATIHYLGSTSILDHIQGPGASSPQQPPFIWTPSYVPLNFVTHTLRSQLMAPDEYLKTDVRRTNKNWDDPNLQCEKCALSHSGPGGDALDCKYVPPSSRPANTSKSGVDETSNIQIYPNPTNDKLYISTNNTNETSDIQLLDINGRQLYKTRSKDAEVEISLNKYPQGTYLIRVSNATNSVVKKVVKTN